MLFGKKRYINIFLKSILLVSLFSCASAFANNEQILCPSPDLIKSKWQHIDTVQIIYEKRFLVYSDMDSVFDEQSKLWWQIAAYVASAPDFNIAFTMGQNNVRTITNSQEKYAKTVNGIYGCSYVDNTGMTTIYAEADMRGNSGKLKNLINHLSNQ